MSRIAIVGASGTIGRVVAQQWVNTGGQVLLLGRDASKLAPLANELAQPFAVFDPRQSESLQEALQTHGESGSYQGIINCSGSLLLKPAHTTTDAEFHEVIEANLFTAFATVRAAGKLLRPQGGAVVLFGSAAAECGLHNHEAIAATKGGVVALARSAAATYAGDNIRFNVISPGLVRTELTRRIWENPISAAASEAMHPLGRLGEPEQVASLALWLLDPRNDWITGQVIGLDGGLARLQPRRRAGR